MLRIVTHIEQLLLMHDCIIIPKLGGFVLQNLPARYRADAHAFLPMRKEVVFNTTLQHDDGLLSESYMQMCGVDYRKARLMWEEDVEELKRALEQEKKISLGRVGSFERGAEGQLIFHPGDAHTFSIESYGLPAFELPSLEMLALQAEEREEVALLAGKKKAHPASVRSTHWNFFRAAAATAAAIAFFLVVSTPVKEVNQAAYTASFVPTEVVAYKVSAPDVSSVSVSDLQTEKARGTTDNADQYPEHKKRTDKAAVDTKIKPKTKAINETEKGKSPNEKTVASVSVNSQKAVAGNISRTVLTHGPAANPEVAGKMANASPDSKKTERKNEDTRIAGPNATAQSAQPASVDAGNKKIYHIVIASFPSESQANEYIAGIDRNECKHVSKVVRDGRYRIYADKFDNRKEAETYMAALRKNSKYKDAWLFISR